MSAIFSDYALIEANKRRIIAGDKSQVVSGKSCFQTKTIFLSYKFTMAVIFKKKYSTIVYSFTWFWSRLMDGSFLCCTLFYQTKPDQRTIIFCSNAKLNAAFKCKLL